MVKFVKQSDKAVYPNRCFSSVMSSAHKDVFDGSQASLEIMDRPYKQGMILEIPTSDTPAYGSGTVSGYKLGLYINSITQANTKSDLDSQTIGIFRLRRGITEHQGNFGTTIQKDIYSGWAGLTTEANPVFFENFSIEQDPKAAKFVVDSNLVTKTDPYMLLQDAYDNKGLRSESFKDKNEFFDAYGSSLEDGTKVIFVERVMDKYEGKLIDTTVDFNPVKYEGPNALQILTTDATLKDANFSADEKWGVHIPPEYHWYAVKADNSNADATNDPTLLL